MIAATADAPAWLRRSDQAVTWARTMLTPRRAAWLRAFHAVVSGVVRAFGPDVLVTQHGTDSHREDPLADLNLSIDGQRTSYEALSG
ncbi:MAG TPA: hypothetical protein VFC16_05975 [Nakamurella sp.]|jgi:Histone deacetylase domain|nr:hypothetical protein [Nakamurella sp.]